MVSGLYGYWQMALARVEEEHHGEAQIDKRFRPADECMVDSLGPLIWKLEKHNLVQSSRGVNGQARKALIDYVRG